MHIKIYEDDRCVVKVLIPPSWHAELCLVCRRLLALAGDNHENPWWRSILDEPLSCGILWHPLTLMLHTSALTFFSYLVISYLNGINLCYCVLFSKESVCAALLDAFWPAPQPQLKQNRSRTKASQLCFCRCKHRRIGEDLGRNTTGIGCIGSMAFYGFEGWEDREKWSS